MIDLPASAVVAACAALVCGLRWSAGGADRGAGAASLTGRADRVT
jgi:hypothetical protein